MCENKYGHVAEWFFTTKLVRDWDFVTKHIIGWQGPRVRVKSELVDSKLAIIF